MSSDPDPEPIQATLDLEGEAERVTCEFREACSLNANYQVGGQLCCRICANEAVWYSTQGVSSRPLTATEKWRER